MLLNAKASVTSCLCSGTKIHHTTFMPCVQVWWPPFWPAHQDLSWVSLALKHKFLVKSPAFILGAVTTSDIMWIRYIGGCDSHWLMNYTGIGWGKRKQNCHFSCTWVLMQPSRVQKHLALSFLSKRYIKRLSIYKEKASLNWSAHWTNV